MNDIRALIIVFYAIVLFTVLVVFLVLNKRYETQKDFLGFFIMGIAWIAIGLLFGMWGFTAGGLILTLIGVINIRKWRKHKDQWANLSRKDRNIKIMLASILILLVFAGIVLYFTVL